MSVLGNRKQEVEDFLDTSWRESFILILPQVSLRTLGNDDHVQKSHLRHEGEKIHSCEPQQNRGYFQSLTWHNTLKQTTWYISDSSITPANSCISLGICHNIHSMYIQPICVSIIVKVTQIRIENQIIHFRCYDRTFQLQTSKQILELK